MHPKEETQARATWISEMVRFTPLNVPQPVSNCTPLKRQVQQLRAPHLSAKCTPILFTFCFLSRVQTTIDTPKP